MEVALSLGWKSDDQGLSEYQGAQPSPQPLQLTLAHQMLNVLYCTCAQGPFRPLVVYTVSQKKGPTLKRYSSKLYGSILMIFGRNIQKSLE